MSAVPNVSVVMSVYNGAKHVVETLDSVLDQRDCDFELVVVEDGSSDDTGAILDRRAALDPRMRVIHQNNTGLTLALARGCAEARGDLIARQDAGDISLPGRLAAQQNFLKSHPEAVMAACAVQFSGPELEPLYSNTKPMMALHQALTMLEIDRLGGPPHHGATMFRRDVYLSVGGYRQPFAVAQDIDLWLRMGEYGLCLGMSELLYEARLEAGSISSRRRQEQFRLGALAIECTKRRRAGQDEKPLLDVHIPSPPEKGPANFRERARFHYFIASCLRGRYPDGARRYYRLALRDNPLHLKALLRCIFG